MVMALHEVNFSKQVMQIGPGAEPNTAHSALKHLIKMAVLNAQDGWINAPRVLPPCIWARNAQPGKPELI